MKSSDTFISVDIETTGLDPKTHEIIEIGAVKIEEGRITGEFSQLIKPLHTIPNSSPILPASRTAMSNRLFR